MTATDFAAIRKALGLSHAALAALVGVDQRSSRRWEAGEREIPPAVAKLLRLLDARRLTVDDVREA